MFKGSHNTHAFAAKFPPQLPRLFIEALTQEKQTILDPMAGSGTTLVEAALLGRTGVGVDLDPLAALITQAKILPFNPVRARSTADNIVEEAHDALEVIRLDPLVWEQYLATRQPSTRDFIKYWFEETTAKELFCLSSAVTKHAKGELKPFFRTVFSSLIVTKSGGVSLARDLAHSRPHKVNTKSYKYSVKLFSDKAYKSIESMQEVRDARGTSRVLAGDARSLPLSSASVDLVVTSPPYANAIDYVRAHKFSLIWMGMEVAQLAVHRKRYIGAEAPSISDLPIPSRTAKDAIAKVRERDPSKARTLSRYFREMKLVLGEIERVLKPGKPAIVVVGSSTMRNIVIPTALALAEIGDAVGLKPVAFHERTISRDRRLMPISSQSDGQGIEARMHTEHVICFRKASGADPGSI
jgi:DNA modification methylase